MGFVILSGGIDLSVGSVLALTTMVAAWLLQSALAAAAWSSAGAADGHGLRRGMGAADPRFRLQPFIVTLAGMFLARGLCYLISIDSISIDEPFFVAVSQIQHSAAWGGFGVDQRGDRLVVLLLARCGIAHCTPFGRAVYAIGGNEQSAMMMGLPVGAPRSACMRSQRLLRGAGRRAVHLLHAVRLRPACAGAGARRDRRGGHRRHVAGTLLAGGYGYVAGALSGVLVLGAIQTLIAFDGTLSSWWTKDRHRRRALLFVVLRGAAQRAARSPST
jgi:ribose/xylose/arabinose/galactoside ABC-type transport system permease subunit